MRKSKNTSKIILAVLVAILVTVISHSVFKGMNKQIEEKDKLIDLMQKTKAGAASEYAYAVAKSNLKSGEIVSDTDVDFQNFDAENKDAFDSRSMVINKVLLKDISSGDVFTKEHIAQISGDDISLKEGYRALTIPVNSIQGRSTKMLKGSFVDVYSSSNEDESWVLDGVRILDLEGNSLAGLNASNANNITFEVSVNEIADFISHASKGGITLIARNPGDRKTVAKSHKTSSRASNFSPSYSSLPSLPTSPPISDFSGLPQPIQPVTNQYAVEVIEANVKSKVTFD